MAVRRAFAAEAERDFGLIFDHHLRSCLGFGESPENAFDHSGSQTARTRGCTERILAASCCGERHDGMQPGQRHFVIGRKFYWFDIDEPRAVVRVLAVFFGGQDHVRHMLARLLED